MTLLHILSGIAALAGDLALVLITWKYLVLPKLDARARRCAQYEITIARRLRPVWPIRLTRMVTL